MQTLNETPIFQSLELPTLGSKLLVKQAKDQGLAKHHYYTQNVLILKPGGGSRCNMLLRRQRSARCSEQHHYADVYVHDSECQFQAIKSYVGG